MRLVERANLPNQIEAVPLGHQQIADEHVWSSRANRSRASSAEVAVMTYAPVLFQRGAREAERLRIIVDDHHRDAAQERARLSGVRRLRRVSVRRPQRQPDFEHLSAMAAAARRRDGAAVQLREMTDDVETEAETAVSRVGLLSP